MDEIRQVVEITGVILPLSIMLIDDDDDRQFLTEIYCQYKPLMYKVAYQFFSASVSDIEDAVGNAVERICKKCDLIKAVNCNKRASYIVSIVRNICLTRLRELKRQRLYFDYGPNEEALETVSAADDVEDMVLNTIPVASLLNAFSELNEKDRELIRMRHIDNREYDEIALLSGLSEGAARTAVCRAKSKLESIAMKRQEKGYE